MPLFMAFFKKQLDFILKMCDYISCKCRQPEVLVYSCFDKGRRKNMHATMPKGNMGYVGLALNPRT